MKYILFTLVGLVILGVLFTFFSKQDSTKVVTSKEVSESSEIVSMETGVYEPIEGVLQNGQEFYFTHPNVGSKWCNEEEKYFNCPAPANRWSASPEESVTEENTFGPYGCEQIDDVLRCKGYYRANALYKEELGEYDMQQLTGEPEELYECGFLVTKIEKALTDSEGEVWFKTAINNPVCIDRI